MRVTGTGGITIAGSLAPKNILHTQMTTSKFGIGTSNPIYPIDVRSVNPPYNIAVILNSKILASGYDYNSDRRIKYGIKPVDGKQQLSNIMALKPCTFAWKSDISEMEHIGLIAQDVEEVLPNCVKESHEFKGLDYNQLTSIGLSALQELILQMRSIESRFTIQ